MNSIRLAGRFEAQMRWVNGNPNQLKQVFINCIKNDVEAMPGGGTIAIQLLNLPPIK